MLLLTSADFFQNRFFYFNSFRNTVIIRVSNSLNSDQTLHFVEDTTQWLCWSSNQQPFGLDLSTLPLSHCTPIRQFYSTRAAAGQISLPESHFVSNLHTFIKKSTLMALKNLNNNKCICTDQTASSEAAWSESALFVKALLAVSWRSNILNIYLTVQKG